MKAIMGAFALVAMTVPAMAHDGAPAGGTQLAGAKNATVTPVYRQPIPGMPGKSLTVPSLPS